MSHKKFNGFQAYKKQSIEKSYLQIRLTACMPQLMEKVTQADDGKFVFTHEKFPDLRVEGLTISFVEEHLERAMRRQLRGQSDKHIDYLLSLLLA